MSIKEINKWLEEKCYMVEAMPNDELFIVYNGMIVRIVNVDE